jgi:glycosyltransferase involved in cell wall biosynthesis
VAELPLVSVVVASYNGERFLRPALESVFAQAYEPREVILVDDGSEDATPAIAQSFPLRYLRQENRGPSAARNLGIEAAAGAFVTFLDDDDLMPPGRLEVQAGYLFEHPETGCVLGHQEWIDPPPWLARDRVYGELAGIPLAAAMIRRSALEDVGGFDASLARAEDRDLLVRLRERGVGIHVLPDVVLVRRYHGANQTAPARRPAVHPLTRSLKAKLDRERARREVGP